MAAQGQGEPLRWGDEERSLVYEYLNDGRLDPNRIGSAAYLRSVKVREAVWDRHINRNFYQNVRRMVAAWAAGQERGGGRRDGNEEAEEEEDGEGGAGGDGGGAPGPAFQPQQPAAPEPQQARPPPPRAPRDRGLASLLAGLRIGEDPQVAEDIEEEDNMLLYHQYPWYEAIAPGEERGRANIRLKRLTIDLLLPGPTSLDQIRAVVSDDGRILHFTYRPPRTYLSHDRTTVRLASATFGRNVIPHVRDTLGAATRAQAHRTALETIRPEQEQKVRQIRLDFPCDRNFCRRDDWGRDNRTEGMEIGMYRHEDPDMQQNNQFVWILHIELSAAERPLQDPLSPGTYGAYADHA